jgi:UDP-N-acetylmuramate dehydrogenase
MNISRTLSQEGKSGLEFGAGIPASLGGAVKMNAGAHGCSIATVVEGAVVCELDGTLRYLSNVDLNYSYRHSSILPSQIVVAVSLKLQDGDPETIKGQRQKCLDYRTKTQPLKFPSSGSVFRNPESPNLDPPKLDPPESGTLKAAAYYLEQVGLKGHRLGGVGYSELHSNWLVRLDDSGRAEEVRNLIELGKKRVFEKFGLELKPEILQW